MDTASGAGPLMDWYTHTFQAVPWYMEVSMWVIVFVIVFGAVDCVVRDLRGN